jgi:hypothetical protein
MIGKIIGIIILLVVLYFAWDFIFACCPMLQNSNYQNVENINQGISDTKNKEYQQQEAQRLSQSNPPIRYEQQYNPGKDQYLTEKYRMQDIPSNLRPWNP